MGNMALFSRTSKRHEFRNVPVGGSKPRRFCIKCGIAESVASHYPCEPGNKTAIEARVPAADRIEV